MFDMYSKIMLDLNSYNKMLRIKIINYFIKLLMDYIKHYVILN